MGKQKKVKAKEEIKMKTGQENMNTKELNSTTSDTNADRIGVYCKKRTGCNCKGFEPQKWNLKRCKNCRHMEKIHVVTDHEKNEEESQINEKNKIQEKKRKWKKKIKNLKKKRSIQQIIRKI